LAPIRCPSCHAENEPPQAAGPFFCTKCHAIVDPKGALKAPAMRPPGDGDVSAASVAGRAPMGTLGSPFAASSRKGQGHGLSVGGSVVFGYVLAAIVGVALAVGVGFLSALVLRVPLLYPFLIGWGIRRALAAGSGGGTPDRGPIGALVLLAVVVASFGILRYVEYVHVDQRESAHYRAVYGGFPPPDMKTVEIALHQRDDDADGKVYIPESKSVVEIDEEVSRLQGQSISGVQPTTAYDIALISAVGKKGFSGHLLKAVKKGDTVTLRPGRGGWDLPGIGIIVLWFLELVLLLLSAFARIDDD
jgi:hypothetical protein